MRKQLASRRFPKLLAPKLLPKLLDEGVVLHLPLARLALEVRLLSDLRRLLLDAMVGEGVALHLPLARLALEVRLLSDLRPLLLDAMVGEDEDDEGVVVVGLAEAVASCEGHC